VPFEEWLDKRSTAFTEEELNSLLDGLRKVPYTRDPYPEAARLREEIIGLLKVGSTTPRKERSLK
jgi:hypothetical protein